MGFLDRWFGRREEPPADIYAGLRNRALSITPEELGLAPDAQAPIYGVVMETGFPDSVATFVCLGDGTVSLYTSRGGGVIGGGQHEGVRAACLEMFAFANRYAQEFLAAAPPAPTRPLPTPGKVRFYLLTSRGVHGAKCSEQELVEQRDPFSRLFVACNRVMTALRQIEAGQRAEAGSAPQA